MNIKKHILISSILLSFAMAQPAYADWKDTLNSGLDKAKELVNSSDSITLDLAPASKEIKPTVTEESVVEHWESLNKRFSKIYEIKEKQEDAPKQSGFLKKGKDKYQDDINELLGQIFETISDEDLEDYKKQLIKNADYRKEQLSDLSKLKENYRFSFDADDKEKIQNNILKLEEKIAYTDAKKSEIIVAVQNRLSDFGTYVTEEQVEALLIKVNADDILSMTTIFPIISEFANYLGQVTQDTGEDLEAAKKYYGMYVMLLELQLFIQDQYINKLDYTFIPQINELRKSNVKLIEDTKRLVRKAKGNNKNVYQNNLDNQRFTLKAVDLYKKQLQSDLKKIKNAKYRLKEDYLVAVNTYKTVDLSFNVANLINENSKLFDDVMNLQAPDLISFENEKMKEEFEKLTAQMQ
ncbi:hypothetical protein ACFFUS_00910 [Vibrio gallaecicus]|uniref:hypothetical protein n=2 Tax=Vibrio gallaecicus TaxID=552386 RepID=UPI0010C9C326|nr:hypothetical protein [Vibrio gallaecicus]